jgi:phosphoribosylformimino-5-aminoimidazole carboxamide ribotide isomerase
MFRPCIDLHNGKVKQIVGGSIDDADTENLKTNFVSKHSPAYYANLYKKDELTGGHVIMLGSGNEGAAREALGAYPQGLQVGGGINDENAESFLENGASHVIVTSFVFREGRLDESNLEKMVQRVGRERLVLDLSCRKRDGDYIIVTDRWQNFTDVVLSAESLSELAGSCAEFLIHAVDVEGLCEGVDEGLVSNLANWSSNPVTYAGGARDLKDLSRVEAISAGKVDLTIGSALDIFGGQLIRYEDAVKFNRDRA